jgi:hypothetical protein
MASMRAALALFCFALAGCSSTPPPRWETGGARVMVARAYWERGEQDLIEIRADGNVYEGEDLVFIIDTVGRAGVTAIVGYMKRYDPGYEFGAARMQAMEDVRLIRVHDFAADFDLHAALFTLVSRDDLSPALRTERREAIQATQREALGPDHAHLSGLFEMLLMLGSHDLTILRGAFGAPAAVRYSDAVSPTQLLSVVR